jgi:hypothetical protein
LNENAKVWAQYEGMPEANHNMVVGIEHAPDRHRAPRLAR